jgi:hypothetical protein
MRVRSAAQSTGAVRKLAEARARHDAAVEEMKAHFDAEVAALRSELKEG